MCTAQCSTPRCCILSLTYEIELPMGRECASALQCGDSVSLSGVLYTARDAAHERLARLIAEGGALPFELDGATIYYAGPTPPRPGQAIGSAGPTSAYRMDAYTPVLLRHGLRAMIGKGGRSAEVAEAMREAGAVYLSAVGGTGALLGERVTASEVIAFPELGAEAVFRLTVKNFPAYVVIDAKGGNLYSEGPAAYLKSSPRRDG